MSDKDEPKPKSIMRPESIQAWAEWHSLSDEELPWDKTATSGFREGTVADDLFESGRNDDDY